MSYGLDTVAGRFLAGDDEALAEVGRWVAGVLAAPTFWALRPSWSDLHQEATGRLIESLRRSRYDVSKDFRSYVQGVARFTAYKAVHRDVREPVDSLDERDREPATVADPYSEDRLVAAQLARQALEVASDDCRVLITAYFLEELDYQELAAERDLPVGTVKSRLFRCMQAIQRILREPAGHFRE